MTAFAAAYLPQFRTSTLNVPGGINASQTTGIVLTTIPSDLDITKPGWLCLTFSNPINTDNAEWIYYSSIDGTNALQGVVRAGEGYAGKAHLNGAAVAWVISKSHINSVMDALSGVTTGVILSSPKLITATFDTNGNEIFKITATASAVNEITIANAATGNSPTISATGDDTNIDLVLAGKGSGKVKINSRYGVITSDTDGATITFNLATSDFHTVALGGNRTLVISNPSTGQRFFLELVQDGTGSRTVTWFKTDDTVTITIAAPGVITTAYDIPTGTPVVFTTTGALPTGITAGTVYWWIRQSATTGNIATSFANAQAGTQITTSGSQSGVQTMSIQIRWGAQATPTLSTGKYTRDCFAFYVVSPGIYIGATVVQNA